MINKNGMFICKSSYFISENNQLFSVKFGAVSIVKRTEF
jgi:hypothetical protein